MSTHNVLEMKNGDKFTGYFKSICLCENNTFLGVVPQGTIYQETMNFNGNGNTTVVEGDYFKHTYLNSLQSRMNPGCVCDIVSSYVTRDNL
jgi:hypothetical protein